MNKDEAENSVSLSLYLASKLDFWLQKKFSELWGK